LVGAPTVVNPQTVALAAALGYDELVVARQPRLAAIITGDEILSHGAPPTGRLRDAIGPALHGLVPAVGGQLTSLVYVNDYRDVLLDALEACDGELIAVSGSSSVGRADYLRAGLEQLGAEPIVCGVACRPGHTQSLWRLSDGRLVVGLPGNPFAALVAFLTLIVPCCVGLLGRELEPLRRIPVEALRSHPTKTRLVPVRLGEEHIHAIGYDGSAMLRGLAVADALAVVPPARAAHDRVELLPMPGNPVPMTPGARPRPGKDHDPR
jgi:molybdopterin molybdotransferase